MTLCFATNNEHKIAEVNPMLAGRFMLVGLKDIGCHEELPENQTTIEGNAIEKATYVYEHYGVDCFADDTGLEVTALNGEPGVYSARYAGPERDATKNMKLLLHRLADHKNRSARFKTTICLFLKGKMTTFEGIAEGVIIENPRGDGGFGYDPVFVPDGYDVTFAEMKADQKNQISHRARAIQKLINYLLKVPI